MFGFGYRPPGTGMLGGVFKSLAVLAAVGFLGTCYHQVKASGAVERDNVYLRDQFAEQKKDVARLEASVKRQAQARERVSAAAAERKTASDENLAEFRAIPPSGEPRIAAPDDIIEVDWPWEPDAPEPMEVQQEDRK